MLRICSLCVPALLAGLPAASPVSAGPAGVVRVIDGDTVLVGGERVRLHGIDAPEHDQTCRRADGRDWACGAWATAEARARFEGRRAVCAARDRDRYGRIVARCEAAGEDMGARLVAAGAALAYRRYSHDYVPTERAAARAGRGIHGSRLLPPEAHRRADTPAAETSPEGCRIKGNISRDGKRIYHVPGQRDYAATRISSGRGERWFCSEGEARAAGWRPAVR
jgi:endonuclease YncB( thermonuclease family)